MELALLLFLLLPGVVFVLFVHEIGHLLGARYYGIKVRCLSVGFGPQLLSFGDRFGTSWKLRALPIDGSCILEFSDEQKSKGSGDSAALTLLSRSAVIHAAGPIFNLLLAGLLLFVPMLCATRDSYGDDLGSFGIMIVRLIAELSFATALPQKSGERSTESADDRSTINHRALMPRPAAERRRRRLVQQHREQA